MVLSINALISSVIIGFICIFLLIYSIKRMKKKSYDAALNPESGSNDLIDKPHFTKNAKRRIQFSTNEFFYDRWLRVIRLRKDRRIDYKSCLINDGCVKFEDKSQYIIDPKKIWRYQGNSYYFVVEGKADLNPFDNELVMSDKEFFAKYNSARVRELYLMSQYPMIKIIGVGVLVLGLLVFCLLCAEFGYIQTPLNQKLDYLMRVSGV